MRKSLFLMAAAALSTALSMTSCSNEADELSLAAAKKTLSVTLTLPDDAGTRATFEANMDGDAFKGLKTKWETGDEVSVGIIEKPETATIFKATSVSDDGKTATFSGEAPSSWGEIADETEFWFVYPKLSDGVIDYSAQEGTLTALSNYDALWMYATYSGGTFGEADIERQAAFFRLPSGLAICDADFSGNITLEFTGEGIISEYDSSALEAFVSADADHPIKVGPVAVEKGVLKSDVYVSLPSFSTLSSLNMAVKSTEASKLYTLEYEMARGKIYTLTDMSKLTEVTEEEDPLTIEATAAGTITIKNPLGLKISYKKNGGDEVTSTKDDTSDITIDVAADDKVQFFGDNEAYAKYIESEYTTTYTNIQCSATSKVYGNIMSLISSSGYSTTTAFGDGTSYNFYSLFRDNKGLTDASGLILPATTLGKYCYLRMFDGCTSLISAPELPAKTLAESCYFGMFYGCTNLTSAPELPATTLEKYCYDNMFYGCSNLTTAPKLPATTLEDFCYYGMFYGCTNLTSAPELPATPLKTGCYEFMFSDCISLETAPKLSAETLEVWCYYRMFYGCTKLASVTCLATDISASGSTYDWLSGVAAEGTFTKAASMEGWETGTSGIPSGWTTVE